MSHSYYRLLSHYSPSMTGQKALISSDTTSDQNQTCSHRNPHPSLLRLLLREPVDMYLCLDAVEEAELQRFGCFYEFADVRLMHST
jgi:hypothetical protein